MNYDLHGLYEVIIAATIFATVVIAHYLSSKLKDTTDEHSKSFK